ncbi:P27 family phage terminase small subunit [Cupriavidus sp. SS-3]|uniref:P27 family phage terminase small subunit n=1 Tax=Cupriavidus sp. SS-3 TaxID=3109596 RepID=UPI002DB7F5F2|nr:P27 family phage terminase small subunit [Cupriavidus sp. SS-3]MEC3769059.1 P27 family phage terminase small subunit [Cupriavidus sp. SS-3]
MKATTERNLTLAVSRQPWEASPLLTVRGAAAIWDEIVAGVNDDHFAAADEVALATLCDSMARYRRVSAALERLPISPTDDNRLKVRRVLLNEIGALRAFILATCRALRLAPVARRARDQSSTAMPTRNRRSRKPQPGDDLFSC